MIRIAAVLPARYASSRFPGKPLATILGKPMIWWAATRTAQARLIQRVVIATDDERIHSAALNLGLECAMTRIEHPSGTDRVAEVAAKMDVDIIVNVQGDEPLVEPGALDALLQVFYDDPGVGMATLACPSSASSIYTNPDRVKVVLDARSNALYFSRAAIPYHRDEPQDNQDCLLHVGIYAFTKETLFRFTSFSPTPLEQCEKLEQLRALENGMRVKVVTTPYAGHGVDRPEDIPIVERRLSERSILK